MANESEARANETRDAIIAYFVNAAQAFGIPKSIGEIYGLFFATDAPLALDDVIEQLQISKGSASQGIRFLRSINALNLAYIPGDRRDHFKAETSLRRIADGLIKERIKPQLASGTEQLKAIEKQSSKIELNEYQEQLATIRTWSKKADLVLPFVSKFLGDKEKPIIL
ncbi:transcriptional regulator [Pelagicoccus sp. NFK12]|uniref:HTH-type transcriptional regulator n=1 Tax=Pelagicoccus enzymogenes TaxID=2773457 RepID=A0A927FBR4_9BACT|nr:transcriptional regulator [Pelagicoccus enzymogenes]MBD5781465.1 transcriptional regulator [Pelagicoccus enzymogenes]